MTEMKKMADFMDRFLERSFQEKFFVFWKTVEGGGKPLDGDQSNALSRIGLAKNEIQAGCIEILIQNTQDKLLPPFEPLIEKLHERSC